MSRHRLTRQILYAANTLEAHCSSIQIEEDSILPRLAGNWELLWTAQDLSNLQKNNNPFLTFINPIENQSYSNNPRSRANADNAAGRSNPILPLVSLLCNQQSFEVPLPSSFHLFNLTNLITHYDTGNTRQT